MSGPFIYSGIPDVTIQPNDIKGRTVSLNKGTVRKILGVDRRDPLPEELYIRLYANASRELLVEGLAALNTGGRYYIRGTRLPDGHPLKSDDYYYAEMTMGVPPSIAKIIEAQQTESAAADVIEATVDEPRRMKRRYVYVGTTKDYRGKFGITDDIDATGIRHATDSMTRFRYEQVWELSDAAYEACIAISVETATKHHFWQRIIGGRKEWCKPGTPMDRVVSFIDEKLLGQATPIDVDKSYYPGGIVTLDETLKETV